MALPPITIRQFRDEHLPRVQELFRAGMEHYFTDSEMQRKNPVPQVMKMKIWPKYIETSLSQDLSLDGLRQTYLSPGSGFFVAWDTAAGDVVGFVGAEAKGSGTVELR